MDKNSFVLYTDYYEHIENLTNEEAGQLIKAIFQYEMGKDPEFENRVVGMAFSFIKSQLKRDSDKYADTIEKRKKAGSLGGKQKVANLANAKSATKIVANVADTVTVTDTVTDNVINNNKKASAPKKKYGEYQNVTLTDAENQKLIDEFGKDTRDKAITFLDEYIQEKQYKSKSHYLAIRRWVIDAVSKQANKTQVKPTGTNAKIHDYDERRYDQDFMNSLMGK